MSVNLIQNLHLHHNKQFCQVFTDTRSTGKRGVENPSLTTNLNSTLSLIITGVLMVLANEKWLMPRLHESRAASPKKAKTKQRFDREAVPN